MTFVMIKYFTEYDSLIRVRKGREREGGSRVITMVGAIVDLKVV